MVVQYAGVCIMAALTPQSRRFTHCVQPLRQRLYVQVGTPYTTPHYTHTYININCATQRHLCAPAAEAAAALACGTVLCLT